MNRRIAQIIRLAVALLILPLFSFGAAAQIAVSSNDGKAVLINGVTSISATPVDDTVTIINLGVTPPKVMLKMPMSSPQMTRMLGFCVCA
jgi:hypothetical protein